MRKSILHSTQSNSNEGFGYNSYAGKADFVIPAKVKIDGFAHNHFNEGYSVFSPSDLVQLYSFYTEGGIRGISKFSMHIVTSQGTAYSIAIEDETKFAAFGNSNFCECFCFN